MTKTVLINKQNKLKDSYFKRLKLTTITNIDNSQIQIEEETYEAYKKFKKFLLSKNIEIGIKKAYIEVENQKDIYNEHCTGLAIDITIKEKNNYIDLNNISLEQEKAYDDIHKHLSNFGFILRYPKSKELITGYPYNPYHIRYVGNTVSKIIFENNYTLEEYLQEFSGIILVNKEKNMTSFDVVNEISHTFGIKKVGHTGTLDPLAEGVLIVAIGKATKVVELLTATYKEYVARVKLGIKTDTLDITGNILEERSLPKIDNLEETLQSFQKTYLQEVPIYSAVKVNGKKLYEYARNNEKVNLPKKEVTIKEISLLTQTESEFEFKVLVSKGCYIRSLINDIVTSLHTIGTMTFLTRTRQGKITLNKTNSLSEIRNNIYKIYNIEDVLDIPVIILNDFLANQVKTGKRLNNTWNIKDKVIFKDKTNKLLGIYEVKDNYLITWKNFV